MYQDISDLILYGNIGEDSILSRIGKIFFDIKNCEDSGDTGNIKNIRDIWKIKRDINAQLRRLTELAVNHDFQGSVWNNYLTWLILNNENPFSLSCENGILNNLNVNNLARHDFEVFKKLFNFNFEKLNKITGVNFNFNNFNLNNNKTSVENIINSISEKISKSESSDGIFHVIKNFYETNGVGDLGFYRAFRLSFNNKLSLEPIINLDSVSLDDMTGYEMQKRELRFNTEAFISGRPANNVLLYGDSGTGKSTSIKALINDYRDSKLRMIEIYKHQFKFLPELISKIKKRNYKFIIFIDDLSFEESETEYKFLKAVIEGGLEIKPENILIYATSNRRHIVREVWSDRSDMEHSGDVHRSDTLEEKLSLASRFGVAINYSAPTRKEYHEIVKNLAEKSFIKNKIIANIDTEELLKGADTWEIRHGGKSGRTAQQYMDYLAGNAGL